MSRVVVIEAPQPVVALEDAKAHLLVRGAGDDDIITTFIAAATASIDGPTGWLGCAIGVQTLEARFGVFDGDEVRLPYGPIIDLVSVRWLAADGSERTGDLAGFDVIGNRLWPESGTWAWSGCSTKPEAIRVRYRAGYEAVPASIKAAVLLMTGDLYANRETVQAGSAAAAIPMSVTVETLLAPFRVWR